MFKSNAPAGYICPVCPSIKGEEGNDTLIKRTDVVYQDDVVSVIVNSFVMGQNNNGPVIVVPNTHYENIYELPSEVGHHIFDIAKKMAIAMKQAYKADGVMIKQNNEPASDQHAFHYHMHVIPRYKNDGLNTILPEQKRLADPAERAEYAERLRLAIGA
jgi:histidine triad (HIT) family protein